MTTLEKEMTITRVFNAPRELVWKVWTDPEHLAQWWGPKGFTIPLCEWEVRSGGRIYIQMQAPDGVIYPMDGEFQEILEHKKLGFISAAIDNDGNRLFELYNTILFTEQGSKTKLTMSAKVIKATPEAEPYLAGTEEGWNQSIDKLTSYLPEIIPVNEVREREILMRRTLNASREKVWKVWTRPEHLKNWWGPDGFTITHREMDVRSGGTWRFLMHGPDGRDYPNKIIFREVLEPELLVYKHESDDDEASADFQVTVTFEQQGSKTRLTMRMVFESAEELNRINKEYGAVEGGKQTMGRLEEYVEKTDPAKIQIV